jgi:hypothetical protein
MVLVFKVAEVHTTRNVPNVLPIEHLIYLSLLDVVVARTDAPESFHVYRLTLLDVVSTGRACTTPHREGRPDVRRWNDIMMRLCMESLIVK